MCVREIERRRERGDEGREGCEVERARQEEEESG